MRWIVIAGDCGSAISTFVWAWVICVALSPAGLFGVIIGFEGRLPSLEPRLMFMSVLPGDIFLGAMMAGLVTLARFLPAEERWYNSRTLHIVVQCITLVAVVTIYYIEFKQGRYSIWAMLSPSKAYHHVFLWGFYGYTILTTLMAVIAGLARKRKFVVLIAACLVLGSVWARLFYADSTLSAEEAAPKAANAHTSEWVPFFVDPEAWWKRLTNSG